MVEQIVAGSDRGEHLADRPSYGRTVAGSFRSGADGEFAGFSHCCRMNFQKVQISFLFSPSSARQTPQFLDRSDHNGVGHIGGDFDLSNLPWQHEMDYSVLG